MFNYRIIIGFAALAFVISLLSGTFGAVPFGIILLRTVIGTLVFAALGAAASWVIHTFLPDLFPDDVRGGSDRDRSEGKDGNGVDIVIPEENPHATAGAGYGEDGDEHPAGSAEYQHEEDGEMGYSETEGAVPDTDNDNQFSNLGNIPGLDSIDGSFGPFAPGGGRGIGGNKSVNIMGTEHDPALAAEAIKTMIKKDKEG